MSQFLAEYAQVSDAQSHEVAQRLEAGEPAREVALSLGLTPAGLVAAVARVGLGDESSAGLPLVQGSPVRPQLAAILAQDATLADLLPAASRPSRLALAAGLLQVLDAWDASHHAAQEADDLGEKTTSAAWHMVAHRREPDPSNARYWARRVEPRTAFAGLAPLAEPILTTPGADPGWATRLIDRAGGWMPGAMIDLTGQVQPESSNAQLLRRLQRVEMLVLLGHSLELGG